MKSVFILIKVLVHTLAIINEDALIIAQLSAHHQGKRKTKTKKKKSYILVYFVRIISGCPRPVSPFVDPANVMAISVDASEILCE